jgi:hypothetical protein
MDQKDSKTIYEICFKGMPTFKTETRIIQEMDMKSFRSIVRKIRRDRI